MTDIQNTEPDIEDRGSNIRMMVQHIIKDRMGMMFQEFDRLHRRGIHDNDMVEALTYLEEKDILEQYAEWAEIDLREDDNTTTNPDGVTDPGNNPSDLERIHAENVQKVLAALVEQMTEQVQKDKALWFDFNDITEVVVDGGVDFKALAEAVTKALGK